MLGPISGYLQRSVLAGMMIHAHRSASSLFENIAAEKTRSAQIRSEESSAHHQRMGLIQG